MNAAQWNILETVKEMTKQFGIYPTPPEVRRRMDHLSPSVFNAAVRELIKNRELKKKHEGVSQVLVPLTQEFGEWKPKGHRFRSEAVSVAHVKGEPLPESSGEDTPPPPPPVADKNRSAGGEEFGQCDNCNLDYERGHRTQRYCKRKTCIADRAKKRQDAYKFRHGEVSNCKHCGGKFRKSYNAQIFCKREECANSRSRKGAPSSTHAEDRCVGCGTRSIGWVNDKGEPVCAKCNSGVAVSEKKKPVRKKPKMKNAPVLCKECGLEYVRTHGRQMYCTREECFSVRSERKKREKLESERARKHKRKMEAKAKVPSSTAKKKKEPVAPNPTPAPEPPAEEPTVNPKAIKEAEEKVEAFFSGMKKSGSAKEPAPSPRLPEPEIPQESIDMWRSTLEQLFNQGGLSTREYARAVCKLVALETGYDLEVEWDEKKESE